MFTKLFGHLLKSRYILQLQCKPSNSKDRFTVVVCLDSEIVGRVLASLAPKFSPFLARECNTITAIITGARVNCGAGLGLEAPCCCYTLTGSKCYVQCVKERLTNLN